MDDSASRSYYATFHAATALLLSKGKRFKTHSGVLSAVGMLFVKSEELDRQVGRDLGWLAELRKIGDYGEARHITRQESEDAVEVAASFLAEAKCILSQ